MKNIKFLAVLGLVLLSGCATYSGLQMGSGDFSGKEVRSCVGRILGMPMDNENTRIDQSLSSLGLQQADVYSIEQRSWRWTFPFYSSDCTIISLNASGSKKIPTAKTIDFVQENGDAQARIAQVKAQEETYKESIKKSKKARKGPGEFDDVTTIRGCDDFSPLARDRCREEVMYRNK